MLVRCQMIRKYQLINYQMKSLLNIYLLLALLLLGLTAPTQGTEGFYVSPTSVPVGPELQATIRNVSSTIKITDTYFNSSNLTYGLQNVTLQMILNQGKINVQILKPQVIDVSGARIQLLFNFNYSKKGAGADVRGWGFGSVLTDPINYTRSLAIGTSIPFWILDDFDNITVTDRIKIKRIDPYAVEDLDVITNMFDRAINATPKAVEQQVIEQVNQAFPKVLNDTLNHQAASEKVVYNYTSPSKGKLQLNLTRKNYGFHATPEDGLKFVFVTEFEDWDHAYCDGKSIPQKHLDFNIYGGIQTVHMNCMYEEIVRYMQKKGWLDTKLNSDWETNGFQFYAGDLYDIFSNVNKKVSPISALSGQCKAREQGIGMKPDQTFEANTYLLNITYDCYLKTTNMDKQQVNVTKFEARTFFEIKADVERSGLVFQIIDAEVRTFKFTELPDFPVKDMDLALFKGNQAMKKLFKTYTFGTGFPTLPKRYPRTRVFQDYVIYYDHSFNEERYQQQE